MDSTVGDTIFQREFKTIMVRLDTVSNVTQHMLTDNRPGLNRSIVTLDKVTHDIDAVVQENKQHISTIAANGADLSQRMIDIARKADSLTTSVATMIHAINNGEGSVGMLMKDGQFYYDLKKVG